MRLKYDPRALVVDQTVLCNQACAFCWRADPARVRAAAAAAPHQVMPIDLYRRIVEAAARVETMHWISLCGPMGEPTLVPDLADRGRLARDTGRFTTRVINTNGYALDRHGADDLLDAFTLISVSLDAPDPDNHARLHGKAGQFDRIVANIDCLAAAKRRRGRGAVLQVRFTQSARNAHLWPAFEAKFAGRVDAVLRRKEHAFVDILPEHATAAGARLCNQPNGTVNFTVDGRMTTCCVNHRQEPTFGHIDDGLKDCWEGPAFEAWRAARLDGLCRTCSGLGSYAQRIDGPTARDRERLALLETAPA